MASDIRVQRGNTSYTTSAVTDTISTVDTSKAFARIVSSGHATSGPDVANNTNKNVDDWSATVHLSSPTQITVTPYGTGDGTAFRADWEVWEYVGPAGGPNEFKVVHDAEHTLSGKGPTDFLIGASSGLNPTKIVPYVSFRGSATGRQADRLECTVEIIDTGGNTYIRLTRFDGSNTTIARVVAVEYTGSNWSVQQNIDITRTASGVDVTATISPVTWSQTMIQATFRGDQGLDETHCMVHPGADSTHVAAQWDNGANSTDHAMIFLVSHPDLAVQRVTEGEGTFLASTASTATKTFTAVSSMSEAAVAVYTSCNGTGTAQPRAYCGAQLTSTNQVTLWRGRTGQPHRGSVELYDFSGITTTSSAVTGTVNVTEQADTLSASGSVTAPTFSGTAAVTEQADTLSASGTVSGKHTDDFDGSSLGPEWTVVDNVGDSTVTVASGQVRLSIPSGTPHDPWHPNEATYIRHDVHDADLDVRVKIDSDLDYDSAYYRGHGLLFLTDNGTFLRFDAFNGTFYPGAEIYAAYLTPAGATTKLSARWPEDGGSYIPPYYFRVTRTGDTWEFFTSKDGVSWNSRVSFTQSLTVNYVGLMVNNANGTSPAYEADYDWIQFEILNADVSAVEAADTVAATGTVSSATPVTGSASIVEQPDTLSASGAVTAPVSTGTVNVAEQPDTLAASGAVTAPTFVGTANVVEQPDTLSAAGSVLAPTVSGSAAIVEQADTLAASGTVTEVHSGTVAVAATAAVTVSGAPGMLGGVSAASSSLSTVSGVPGMLGGVSVSLSTSSTVSGFPGMLGDVSATSSSLLTASGVSGRRGDVSAVSASAATVLGRRGALSGPVAFSAVSSTTVVGTRAEAHGGAVSVSAAVSVGVASASDRFSDVAVGHGSPVAVSGGRAAASGLAVAAVSAVSTSGVFGALGAPAAAAVSDVSVSGSRTESYSGTVSVSHTSVIGVQGGSDRASDVSVDHVSSTTVSGILGALSGLISSTVVSSITVSGSSSSGVVGDVASSAVLNVAVSGLVAHTQEVSVAAATHAAAVGGKHSTFTVSTTAPTGTWVWGRDPLANRYQPAGWSLFDLRMALATTEGYGEHIGKGSA